MFAAMMRARTCPVLVLWLLATATTLAAESPLAIQGYDAVAYFTRERATPGDARFEYQWDERRWWFASAENRRRFVADPVRYAPQFANFCAVALARGEVKVANPEYWLISDGKLYLFGKPEGPALFRQNLPANIDKANQHRNLLPGQRVSE
jgi:YHS domain-containing protein